MIAKRASFDSNLEKETRQKIGKSATRFGIVLVASESKGAPGGVDTKMRVRN